MGLLIGSPAAGRSLLMKFIHVEAKTVVPAEYELAFFEIPSQLKQTNPKRIVRLHNTKGHVQFEKKTTQSTRIR